MPLSWQVQCPHCRKLMRRKPGGCCPHCGRDVAAFVDQAREKGERREKVAAIIGTLLVLMVFSLGGGFSLLEGVVAYGAAGAIIFYLAQKTFRS